MPGTTQATSNTITLRGSAQIVSEFFGFSINSILYQRGIYDPEAFDQIRKYNLRLQVTTDQGLKGYLDRVMGQLEEWLAVGTVKKLVLVVTGVDDEEVLERWVFDVDTDEKAMKVGSGTGKSEKQIRKEIGAIIRQITSSVSFLPLLDVPCTFDLLVYTHAQCQVPQAWEESDPKYIANSSQVRLRSFTTTVHKVGTSVAYKCEDDSDSD